MTAEVRVTVPPRPKTKKWVTGDRLTVGATTWIIRVLVGQDVELESTNNPNASIWWRTTLANLPKKVTA